MISSFAQQIILLDHHLTEIAQFPRDIAFRPMVILLTMVGVTWYGIRAAGEFAGYSIPLCIPVRNHPGCQQRHLDGRIRHYADRFGLNADLLPDWSSKRHPGKAAVVCCPQRHGYRKRPTVNQNVRSGCHDYQYGTHTE